MASRSEPWVADEELRVVRRVPIAMSVALEVVAELRRRERDRVCEPTGESRERTTRRSTPRTT